MNISKDFTVEQAITPTNGAAGTTTINGATCDMDGYDAVLMVVTMGAILATAVTSIKAQESSDGTTWADLEGTAQTIADTDDDKTFYIDLERPAKRYARLVVLRGTANATVAEALYFKRASRARPVSQGANVSGEIFYTPVAGTA